MLPICRPKTTEHFFPSLYLLHKPGGEVIGCQQLNHRSLKLPAAPCNRKQLSLVWAAGTRGHL